MYFLELKNVNEISHITKQTPRNVRRIIQKIKDEVPSELLFKDDDNSEWKIDSSLLVKFRPQRIKRNNFYALSIDPCRDYPENEIDKIMEWVIGQMSGVSLEIHYVVQKKEKNAQNHLHCFVRCSNKKQLLSMIKLGFSQVSYHQTTVFDLNNWKNYITRNNEIIKTLKN